MHHAKLDILELCPTKGNLQYTLYNEQRKTRVLNGPEECVIITGNLAFLTISDYFRLSVTLILF